jgi:hypothetical protein
MGKSHKSTRHSTQDISMSLDEYYNITWGVQSCCDLINNSSWLPSSFKNNLQWDKNIAFSHSMTHPNLKHINVNVNSLGMQVLYYMIF